MPGPRDFACVSGLAFLPRMMLQLSPSTLVSHLSPCLRYTLGALGHMILHLSPACLPFLLVSSTLWVLWHDFTFVSHLSPCLQYNLGALAAWLYTCLPLVSLLPQYNLGALGRVILFLFAYSGYTRPDVFTPVSTCLSPFLLHLSPLVAHLPRPTLDALGRMFLHLSPFLLHSSPLASDYSGYTWPELSLACLQLRHSWPEALSRMHLSPLVSLLVSMLGHSRPLVSLVVFLLLPPFLLRLSPLVPLLISLVASLVSLIVKPHKFMVG